VRRPLLHTLNLAHLLPLSGTWAGMAENDHLGAEAHVQAATTGTTPFRVNLNVGDVGHTLVLGKTGSGKSTLLGLLAAQWLRYDDAQVFFFDKGKSSRALTYGVQGAFYEPGGEDTELAFQPLAFVDDKKEREWVAEWLESLIEMQKGEVTAAVREKLWQALERMARQPRERRTMSQLVRLAGDQKLSRWLRAYTTTGPYGDLLDANEETLSLERWVSFEMGALMERKEIVGPILEYLFHRLEARFDGSPTLLMLDEAWIYLDNPTFRARIRQWLKTLRKHNVYVVFASQEIVDALESEIASSLLSACPTRILLPHPGAGSESMRPHFERLGLNGAQIEMLSNAEEKRHYYYSSPRGQRLFELGLERCPIALRFVGASSPEHQEEMDEILATQSREEFAAAWLQRGGFNEAAATVRALREESGEANGFADMETVMAPEFELPVADAGARSRRDPWDAETIVDERFQPKEREAYS
jgi:type IV secretion system protein VirB4